MIAAIGSESDATPTTMSDMPASSRIADFTD
jgi:hypothetical protein